MLSKFFREYILQLMIALTVTSTVTVFALIGKYWNWPNAVVGSILLLCGVFYLTDRLGLGPTLKSRVRDWLDASNYDVRTIQDSNHFHFMMTDNIGLKTAILQVKPDSPISIVCPKIGPLPEQLAAYKALSSDQERKAFWRTVRHELLKYGISFSDLKPDGEGVTFSDLVVVSPSFTSAEFLNRVMFVRSGARLYRDLWTALYDPGPLPVIAEPTVPTSESTVVARPNEVPLSATAQVIQPPSCTPEPPGAASTTTTA